jgi:PhoPQ-activated pathogenicity-related protein
VFVPVRLPKKVQRALLLVLGSQKRRGALIWGKLLAERIGAPVVVLHDVPNQPLFGGLEEDDLVAHTFLKFLQTKDRRVPLLFPMVKSVVRGIDAAQEFLETHLGFCVVGFVVSGASKRGWTTWLTSAMDDRVHGLAPFVYDNLNLSKQLAYQRQIWGKFSDKIAEYKLRQLPQRLVAGDAAAAELAPFVDPFAYIEQIISPKLIILGTNDPYWPLDALNLYYDEIVGEKYILYLPNIGHHVTFETERVADTLSAFFLKVDGRLTFPQLNWRMEEDRQRIHMRVESDIFPAAVNLWTATSPSMDYVETRWSGCRMKRAQGGFEIHLKKPSEGCLALFGEAAYHVGGRRFFLSTRMTISRG